MRARTLADLNSVVDRLCRSIPLELQLTFPRRPRSVADEAPEPKKGRFVALYQWLVSQRQYLEQSLAPLGHHDMDQCRLALLRLINSEIKRLDRMKAKAWSKLVAEELIHAHIGKDRGQGPVVVKSGTSKSHHCQIIRCSPDTEDRPFQEVPGRQGSSQGNRTLRDRSTHHDLRLALHGRRIARVW